MGKTIFLDRIAQCLDDMILSQDILEGPGPILPCKNLVVVAHAVTVGKNRRRKMKNPRNLPPD